MWQAVKDYFSFTRKDIRGIYILLLILTLMLIFKALMVSFLINPEPDFSEFDQMVLALDKARRQAKIVEQEKQAQPAIDFQRPDREIAEKKLNPFPFDPNTLNEEAWFRMGLNARQVRNIQNFRASGGTFRKKEDFKRIYTISDEEFEVLAPFIQIAETVSVSQPVIVTTTEKELRTDDAVVPQAKQETRLQININRADSLELIRVRGIGPVFAQRIIRYRDLLGGYHSPEQLLEVFGLDSSRFIQIRDHFIFDHSYLRMIDVNKAELKDLTVHPYIDFYLAKSIIDTRISKGSYVSQTDLYGIPLMYDALYQKIIPYFRIN